MSPTLDDLYLEWLYRETGLDPDVIGKSYWYLIKQLYTKEFVWIIHRDANRIEDGRELRGQFAQDVLRQDAVVDENWMRMGCSILELLVALSRRLAFEAPPTAPEWFWILLENLGLISYSDSQKFPREEIDEILDQLIWRKYSYDGRGGLFPLQYPDEDQRNREIWYQLQAYLIENC